MSLKALTDDEKGELKEQFCVLDKEESGFIQLNELKDALDLAGFKVPGWRVRDMIDKIDRETTECPGAIVGQRKLSYGEFEHVSTEHLDLAERIPLIGPFSIGHSRYLLC